MNFSSNLKWLIKHRKKTPADVAVAIGVKPNTISNYTNGVSTPNFKLLEVIVKYLDVSADVLLFGNLESNGESVLLKTAPNIAPNVAPISIDQNDFIEGEHHKYAGKDIAYCERILQERDRTVEALNEVINSQKETIEALKIAANIDPKRKTG